MVNILLKEKPFTREWFGRMRYSSGLVLALGYSCFMRLTRLSWGNLWYHDCASTQVGFPDRYGRPVFQSTVEFAGPTGTGFRFWVKTFICFDPLSPFF